jgi:hypothetical protein
MRCRHWATSGASSDRGWRRSRDFARHGHRHQGLDAGQGQRRDAFEPGEAAIGQMPARSPAIGFGRRSSAPSCPCPARCPRASRRPPPHRWCRRRRARCRPVGSRHRPSSSAPARLRLLLGVQRLGERRPLAPGARDLLPAACAPPPRAGWPLRGRPPGRRATARPPASPAHGTARASSGAAPAEARTRMPSCATRSRRATPACNSAAEAVHQQASNAPWPTRKSESVLWSRRPRRTAIDRPHAARTGEPPRELPPPPSRAATASPGSVGPPADDPARRRPPLDCPIKRRQTQLLDEPPHQAIRRKQIVQRDRPQRHLRPLRRP